MVCHLIPIQVAQVAFVSFLVQLGDVCRDTCLQVAYIIYRGVRGWDCDLSGNGEAACTLKHAASVCLE